MTPLGIYVHVPFCERRCGYCAFNTYVLSESGGHTATEQFVAAAGHELELASATIGADRPPLTSLFFGGGTPTMLSAAQLGRVLDEVRRRFEVTPDWEVTVEANPDGLVPGQLAELRQAGVTRVSFGMQSIRPRVLRLLDRTHDPERSLAAVGDARAAGFEHISLDLIYGTPGETDADWAATLEAALSTEVDHVSAYALGIEPGTKLAARVRAGSLPTPDPDEAADRYELADSMLGAAGFDWYEISNWARSDAARCRHNLLYWRNQDWWGVGPGAHSHLRGERWWNLDRPDAWADALASGGSPVAGRERLDETQQELERVMLHLRLAEGLHLPTVDPALTDSLVRDGLATYEDEVLVLSRHGRLLANQVIERIVGSG